MLDSILEKLQCASIEDFFAKEKEIWNRFAGLEIERESPLACLSDEELDFLEAYLMRARA